MKLRNTVLCDEVRQEDNGKLIMIGVYLSDIQIPRFPTTIPLTLWGHFSPPEKEQTTMEIRAKVKDNPRQLLAGGRGQVVIEKNGKDIFITFPTMPVHVTEPCVLVFEIRADEGRWQKAFEIPVSARS